MSGTGSPALPKSPTGIVGLDEVTEGGLPRGRPTLVTGGPGCGKTLFAAEFLVRGATDFGEPGVFMLFEETARDLVQNVASLGFDLDQLIADGKIYVDHVRVERQEIEEAGDYDLEGLFVRLGHAIAKVGARRVAIDTIETLFSGFQNPAILRSELKRLFHWLKTQGVTAVITAERGEVNLTRHALEEYVSDCVILLDHRVENQISTRRLRIVKYRGSTHGTNEYPFLIDEGGLAVVPITSVGLDHEVSAERISTGVPDLDAMLGGEGLYRGSSVMVSGAAGTGKTTLAAHFADAACTRGERTLFCLFEESPGQLARNMRSVGTDLQRHVDAGLLRFQASRPSLTGLEMHLARILRTVELFQPRIVIFDPISALLGSAPSDAVRAMVTRLIDALKSRGVTAFLTILGSSLEDGGGTDVGISSLIDSWILLRDVEVNGERNRGLYVLKARGIPNSNQIREFVITSSGVRLLPPYLGPERALTGSSRIQQAARAHAAELDRAQEVERLRRKVEHRRAAAEAQIAALRAEIATEEAELEASLDREASRRHHVDAAERDMARSRSTGPAVL